MASSERVSLRFVKSDPPYNAGDIAGFSAEEARRKVVAKVAIYRDPADVPEDLAPDPEEQEAASSEEGDSDEGGHDSEPEGGAEPEGETPLPEDFPARAALMNAGINFVEQVPRTIDALVAIKHIGEGYAKRILAKLG